MYRYRISGSARRATVQAAVAAALSATTVEAMDTILGPFDTRAHNYVKYNLQGGYPNILTLFFFSNDSVNQNPIFEIFAKNKKKYSK